MADDGRWYSTRPLTYIERRQLDQGSSEPFKKAVEAKPAQDSKARNRFQGSAGWFGADSETYRKPR